MRYIFCLFILAFLSNPTLAQNDLSRLLSDIDNAPADSLKMDAYRAVFEHYQYEQPDSAQYYADKGLKYFNGNGYKRGAGVMYFLMGNLEGMMGNHEQAKARYNAALNLYKEIGNINGIGQALNGLGVVEGRRGNYLAATRYFMRALAEFERSGSKNGIVNTYLKLGNVSQLSGDLQQALGYFNKGLALSISIRDDRNTAYLYNNLGIVYGKMQMTDTAIACFEKGLAISERIRLPENGVLTLMNLGNAYKDKGDYSKSLHYYNRALKLSRGVVPETEARLMLNIASIKGIRDHKAALPDLLKAKKIASAIGHKALHLEVMEEMILQYKSLGDYKSALETMEESVILKDSMFNLEKDTEIANLMAKQALGESNEKVHQLEESGKKKAAQRNVIVSIAGILTVSLVAISFASRKTRKLNRQLTKSESELQKTNNIKDRIFSIIGHDLRGPIANIPMVIELYQDPRTSDAEKAYMLDLLVENSMASLETLDKLLHWGKAQIKGSSMQQKAFRASNNLQHQVSLIKGMASNKNITVVNKVSADTSVYADEDHFNFIIRNLLSNAIKFSHPNSEVIVEADRYTERGFTTFSVKDSGVGIDKDRLGKVFEAFGSSTLGTNNESGTSIGLMLCKEFAEENGGRIWVESEPGKGTTFSFTLKNS